MAEQSVRKVQNGRDARRFPTTHYVLGSILALKKDFPSAAVEFRRFLQVSPQAPVADQLRKRLVDWEEQGLIKKVDAETASEG